MKGYRCSSNSTRTYRSRYIYYTFVTDDKTTRDIARYYIYAYKKGLKSLYYTRTKMTRENEECLVVLLNSKGELMI